MTPSRILIVEDERIVAEDLKTTLISFGYDVVDIATRGVTAVERAHDLRPDLILMDIHLAGTMNGIKAAEQIHRFSDIPVIYLTAFADEQLLQSAKLTHPYGYILKPYAEREVRAAIEIALFTHGMNGKLKESEAKFHDLLENADDLIQSVNPDGSFIYVNRTWCKTLGYTEEEIKNLTVFNIIHPDSQAHCMELFKRVINGETIDNIQARFITKNGNLIDVEGNANCRFVDGKPVATRSIFRNITERKKMEQAIKDGEETFRGLFNTVKEAIYVMDVDGRFREVNQGALDMFGHTRTFLIGKSCEVLHAAGTFDIGQITNRLERAFKREPQNFEITGCRSNGELFPAECRLYRGLYFGKDVIIGLVIDITESKRAEKALMQANKQLNLLSSITRHDILNQLMALKGYLELSHDVINDPKTLIEYIKKEETAANAIEQQIIFTKNYQVLGVTAPVWQNVNESIKVALSGLPMRDIRVNVDPKDPEIFADPLFNKVFYNLIDNALRYGGADMKMIRISSGKSPTGLTILIEDDGLGISTDDKKRIFIRGFGKNTGLGLFLSREILAITGITIIENGEPGKGARFEITVPKGMWRFTGMLYE